MLTKNQINCGNFFDFIAQVDDESVDLIICDGPYGITQNAWDKIACIQEFNLDLIKRFSRKLKQGGALYLFGKPNCIDFIDYRPYLNLKSKIVWYQPSRLAQGRINYTNNYDIIAYFIKGKTPLRYNLDDIRVAQLVELAQRLRCEKVPSVINGKFEKTKFNHKGKNPGDVWGDIKQLTYKSKELVARTALNTIQKPEKLIKRLILASSSPGDLVLDPFCGAGTCPLICQQTGRDFLAFELQAELAELAQKRLHKSAQNPTQEELKIAYG